MRILVHVEMYMYIVVLSDAMAEGWKTFIQIYMYKYTISADTQPYTIYVYAYFR